MRRNPMATEARETADLIGSDKVEGTAVYEAKGEKMGCIERVMIDTGRGKLPQGAAGGVPCTAHDRKAQRPGRLCGAQLWRLPGHRQRLLSDPLGRPQV